MNRLVFAERRYFDEEVFGRFTEIFIAEGECEVTYAEKRQSFCSGFISFPPNIRHAIKGEGICIRLEQALLPYKEARLFPENSELKEAARQAAAGFIKAGERLKRAYGELIACYAAEASGGEYSPVTAQIIATIEKGISDPAFSLQDALKRMPLNYDYVRKLFKKETGCTPREYLLDERMKLALALIGSGVQNQYSNYSVSQIAEACGYPEPLYFTRVFTAYYGKPPSEFMKFRRSGEKGANV